MLNLIGVLDEWRVSKDSRAMSSRLAVFAVLLGLSACAPVATLSGRWVFLAEGEHIAVGQSNQPSNGGPIHLLPDLRPQARA